MQGAAISGQGVAAGGEAVLGFPADRIGRAASPALLSRESSGLWSPWPDPSGRVSKAPGEDDG